MGKMLAILIIVVTLLGVYVYYQKYRIPVQYEGDARTTRCVKHSKDYEGGDYSNSYLDRLKNVFRDCPDALPNSQSSN